MSSSRRTSALSDDSDLLALARHCGVQRRFVDGTGQRRVASLDAVRAALRAMGLNAQRPGDAKHELRRLEAEAAEALCEPVVVHWLGSAPAIPLKRGVANDGDVEVRLIQADGVEQGWRATRDDLLGSGREAPALRLSEEPPMGAHRLIVSRSGQTEEATLLAAPPRCFQPAREDGGDLGVFIPLHALRSDANLGVGNLGDLERLSQWARRCGAELVGALPLLTTFLDEPFDPSPYAPVSRSVFGELFVDVHDAAERLPLPALRRLLASGPFARKAAQQRALDLVDYRGVWALARRCLEALAHDVFSAEPLRSKVETFAHNDALIREYTAFRASLAKPDRRESERRLFLCAQWLLSEQMERFFGERSGESASERRCLYLDLPVGSHARGFDAQRDPELHARGVSMGAPPDDFFRQGQSWGFPPINPRAARATGHAQLREALDRHLRYAAALRIDHAAGLFRAYWVPDGCSAADGVYVRCPAEEQLAAVSILSHVHRSAIVAENLGTIPRFVNRGLQRRGALEMSVAQFQLGKADKPLPVPPPKSLATLNTHDMPPFAAHWSGADIDLRVELGLLSPSDADQERARRERMRARVVNALSAEGLLSTPCPGAAEALEALLRWLARTGPEILLVSLEDLWLETMPQNVPGVVDDHPNWQRKASRTLDQMTTDRAVECALQRLHSDQERSGHSLAASQRLKE